MDEIKASNLLLNATQTNQKIRRIAYQIYENNFSEKEIVIAGVVGEGFIFAELIVAELVKIAKCKISIAEVSFNKKAASQPEINIKSTIDTFKNKSVIITDDVLNTGRTLAFCLRPFLSIPLKKLQVAVLVDRNHPQFPIAADYVGYALSTTLNEHVQVVLGDEEKKGVYLY
ncbi:MAG: phosphoribosyltransferase family protein [Spirosomaceae bacterium]|nr:phosphoribosyltransferase family protein [Spirosomataceae bacterium]